MRSGAEDRATAPDDPGAVSASYARTFRPVVREDMPLLNVWLRTSEVVRWWGNPDDQANLLLGDLNEPRMSMEIVSFCGRPFAYAQHYDVHAWRQPHFNHLPRGSRAIDSFIGEPEMIGQDHGSAYLNVLALRLMTEGTPTVAIDPDVENLRARRAYEKAGFRTDSAVVVEQRPVVLMVFRNGPAA